MIFRAKLMSYFLEINSLTPTRGKFQVIKRFIVFLSEIQAKKDSSIELSRISNILFVCYLPNTITNFFIFILQLEKLAFNSSSVSSITLQVIKLCDSAQAEVRVFYKTSSIPHPHIRSSVYGAFEVDEGLTMKKTVDLSHLKSKAMKLNCHGKCYFLKIIHLI